MTPRKEFIIRFADNLNHKNPSIYEQINEEKFRNKMKEWIESPFIRILINPCIMQEKQDIDSYKIKADSMVLFAWSEESIGFASSNFSGSFTIIERDGKYKITETNILKQLDQKEVEKKYQKAKITVFLIEHPILCFWILFGIITLITIGLIMIT